MKILEAIKRIIIGIIGIAFFAFALCMTILLLYRNDFGVTQFGKKSLVIINDEISSENYAKGDLVLVEGQKLEDIKQGDEIFAYSVDSKNIAHVNLGLVGDVYPLEKAISFENGSGYSIEYVIGKNSKVYPNVGTYLSIVQSQWGFLFLVLVPGFLIFVYEIYALVIEIKYGEEE